MPLRRYSGGQYSAYSIPYDGEEIKLVWANSDQYYIKSTENYASYVFTVGDNDNDQLRVRFEKTATDDDLRKPNHEKQRRFVLAAENRVMLDHDDLVVRFEHRLLLESEKQRWPGNGLTQQNRINESTECSILEEIDRLVPNRRADLVASAPTENSPHRTLLFKHIQQYAAKNSFDYFIHKDLNGFLNRQLDFYISSEVLNLDDLALGDSARLFRAFVQMRAIRHVAKKVIAFLAQLEDFQKSLWLKKKFVLETEWCITLDRIPEEFYPDIIANSAQREEWAELYAFDKCSEDATGGDSFCDQDSVDLLRRNQSLILDTRHFDGEFKERLLEEISKLGTLDDQTDGLLINGENFSALNFLQSRYGEQIHCVHIDPPYNTNTSGFLYKNGYRHSSWLSMMSSTVKYAEKLLTEKGHFICHIDENEYERLFLLLDSILHTNLETIIWDKRNPMTGGGGIARQHEYIIWHSRSSDVIHRHSDNTELILEKAKSLVNQYGISSVAQQKFSDWVRKNRNLTNGEKAYTNIDQDGHVYQTISLRAPEPRVDPKFFEPLIHPVTKRPCPVPPNGFSRTPETLMEMMSKGEIFFGADESIQPRQKSILDSESSRQLTSMLPNAKKGKADLNRLGVHDFPYAHSTSLYESLLGAATKGTNGVVLDYFAGSGTTGHAVINLNRADNGDRKYVLVEVSDCFDSVLLPRIKKVVHSPNWKNGKPQSHDEGVSQIIKYIRLESYDDTLDGLAVVPKSSQLLDMCDPAFVEDYRLRYAFRAETADSPCLAGEDFTNPFSYQISVVKNGVRQQVPVDLSETFCNLIGLRANSRFFQSGVLAIAGVDPKGQSCLVLWRDVEETNNESLENWFRQNRCRFPEAIDVVYVNGDSTLSMLRRKDEHWVVNTIEPLFREMMFDTKQL